MYKRGQVTIFVIIAIMIVVVFAIIFMVADKSSDMESMEDGTGVNTRIFFKSCIEDNVEKLINILSYQGGYSENKLNTRFKFNGEEFQNISYLCYAIENYESCTIQQPSIVNHLEIEFEKGLKERITECLEKLDEDIKSKGYEVESSFEGFSVDLANEKIKIELNNSLTMKKESDVNIERDFVIAFQSKLYNLAKISQEIISDEANYGSFDRVSFMVKNPEYGVDLFQLHDGSKIYTVKKQQGGTELFRFATRGSILPTTYLQ